SLTDNTSPGYTDQPLASLTASNLGGFLEFGSVTLTFTGTVSGGQFTGDVSIKTSMASLSIGGTLTASLSAGAGDSDSDALVGTYHLAGATADHGTFSFTLDQAAFAVTGLFTANAANLTVQYDPNFSGSQTILTASTLDITVVPFGVNTSISG